jgi:hypothetical protein
LKRSTGEDPFSMDNKKKVYDQVTISNNIASTLVKNIMVQIGETTVSHYDFFFLRNALDNLLHTPFRQRSTIVKYSQLFDELGDTAASYMTKEWNGRHEQTKDGGIFEILIPFNTDLSSTGKFFPPGVDIKITLTLNTPEFYLVKGPNETQSHHIFIEEIYLQLTRASVLPSITKSHETALSKQNVIYPLRYTRTLEKAIAKSTTSLEYDLFIPGQVPYNITLVFMSSSNYNGNSQSEPIFFERFDLETATLRTESKTIDYDYTYLRSAYFNTLHNLNEKNVDINLAEFNNGLFFVYFDLANGVPEGALRAYQRTNLRLSLKWSKPTAVPLSMLMLIEGIGHLEISAARETKLLLP